MIRVKGSSKDSVAMPREPTEVTFGARRYVILASVMLPVSPALAPVIHPFSARSLYHTGMARFYRMVCSVLAIPCGSKKFSPRPWRAHTDLQAGSVRKVDSWWKVAYVPWPKLEYCLSDWSWWQLNQHASGFLRVRLRVCDLLKNC